MVDSVLVPSAPRGVELSGRTTVDVNEYRVRGRFHFKIDDAGNFVLEFSSTSAMGGHREDVVVSWWADTLRVLDRERGAFYQGAEVNGLAADGLDLPVDVTAIVQRVLADVTCASVSRVRTTPHGVEGRTGGGRFSARIEEMRIVSADWPAPLGSKRGHERLRVDYRYRNGVLSGLVVRIPGPRWRVRFDGS